MARSVGKPATSDKTKNSDQRRPTIDKVYACCLLTDHLERVRGHHKTFLDQGGDDEPCDGKRRGAVAETQSPAREAEPRWANRGGRISVITRAAMPLMSQQRPAEPDCSRRAGLFRQPSHSGDRADDECCRSRSHAAIHNRKRLPLPKLAQRVSRQQWLPARRTEARSGPTSPHGATPQPANSENMHHHVANSGSAATRAHPHRIDVCWSRPSAA